MLRELTDEEKLIEIKKFQIAYVLKQKHRSRSSDYLKRIEDSIFSLSDNQVEVTYKSYEEIINKELWVDLFPPLYFHITEFESALKEQLESIEAEMDNRFVQQINKSIISFFRNLDKREVKELTLEEKMEFFWITHPLKY